MLSHSQIAILAWAVGEAEVWRGSLHPDDWEAFDKEIAKARAALTQLRKEKRAERRLKAED